MNSPWRDCWGLQPWVLFAGDLYAKTRGGPAAATLVTGRGAEHALRRVVAARTLVAHHQRLNGRPFLDAVEREAGRRRVRGRGDALRYFVDYLVPAFRQRDWDEDEARGDCEAAPAGRHGVLDPASRFELLSGDLPMFELPSPVLGLSGRVWLLGEMPPRHGSVQVRIEGRSLGLTGDYCALHTLEETWRRTVQRRVAAAGQRLAASDAAESPAARSVSDAVAKNGCLVCGDLLFLAGNPPQIGHIVPKHYNLYLERWCDRDLAMTASLILPNPVISSLGVLQRSGDTWRPLSLNCGLCLGSTPTFAEGSSPGLALIAYLRWAAVQVATNGRFHD